MVASESTLPDPIGEHELLLHVGVHKTGTTALQAALHDGRDELRAAGVLYPGSRTFHHASITSFLERQHGWPDQGAQQHSRRHWARLQSEVRDWPGRTIVTTEFLDETDVPAARSVVEGLVGVDRTQVVVTLRSLANMLPSIYQQDLKSGLSSSYEKWLKKRFTDLKKGKKAKFRLRHDHARVVRTWVDVVGPERVTVVVLPEGDRDAVFNAFSGLLRLPAGFFTGREKLRPNRSMTAAEAALMIELNKYARANMSWPVYQRFIRLGFALAMATDRIPDPDEERIRTPQWALDQALEYDARYAAEIAASGVTVVGDLADLHRPVMGGPTSKPELIKIEAVRVGMVGLSRELSEAHEEMLDLKAELAEIRAERGELKRQLWLGGPVKRAGRKVKHTLFKYPEG